jgi:hypothetical protein
MGVQRLFDPAHGGDLLGGAGEEEIGFFFEPNPVFCRDRPSHGLQAAVDNGGHLAGVHKVRCPDVQMQIAVAQMAVDPAARLCSVLPPRARPVPVRCSVPLRRSAG